MNFNYLNIFNYKNFGLWDSKSYQKDSILPQFRYPVVKLNEVITTRRNFINIDDTSEYKRCRVQFYANGIELRDIARGSEIKTKRQQICKKNDFLVAEIDAKLGGYGIVPKSLEGAIVSNHYFLYEIDKMQLSPQFLELYIKTAEFHKQIKAIGSTNYAAIRSSHVLDYKIPLPDITTQNQIVNHHNYKLTKAQNAENQANELEKGIESYLLEELGIEAPKAVERKRGLQFIRLKELSRWDLWNNLENYISKKFINTTLGTVTIGSPQYGANSKAVKVQSDYRYIRITDLNEDGTLNDDIVSSEKIESQYILENNDLLIARTGATVGKTFLYSSKFGKALFAGYLIRYRLDEHKIMPEYLLFFTKSQIFKNWILKSQRVSAQPNINGQEFLKSVLILPPKEIQTQIVNHITSQKEQIKTLRQQAEALRKQAKEEFEQEIFI